MDATGFLLTIALGIVSLVMLIAGIRRLGEGLDRTSTFIGAVLCIIGGTGCGVVGMIFLGLT